VSFFAAKNIELFTYYTMLKKVSHNRFLFPTRYSCHILMKPEFSRQIFEKYSNIRFHKHPFGRSRAVPCKRVGGRKVGKTDMTKLIVAFRNFSNVTKNITYLLHGAESFLRS